MSAPRSRFGVDVAKWVAGVKETIDKDVRAIEIALFSAIIKATPSDTGRLRGNWQTSVGRPSNDITDLLDPTGAQAIAEVIANVGGAGKVTWLTNNLEYSQVVEYGGYPNPPKKGTWVKGTRKAPGHYEIRSSGGYSRQAPYGMVRISIARFDEIVKDALAAQK